MHANGIEPHNVKEYWTWDPHDQRWDNLTGYTDMYHSLYDADEAKAGDWYFGKLAADWALPEKHPDYKSVNDPVSLEELEPWAPGHHGKFIGFPDGHVQIWRNQPSAYYHDSEDPTMVRDGWPSHSAVAEALGRKIYRGEFQMIGGTSLGFISPEGAISSFKDIPQNHLESVMQRHPGTHPEQGWHFAGIGDWWNRIERGPNWNQPAPTPEQAAQGRMCYYHPDRPAVAAEGFAAMCADCYAKYKRGPQPVRPYQPAELAQKNLRGPMPQSFSAVDDPYYDPDFPTDEQLDAEDDKWWDKIKPGAKTITGLRDLVPWEPGKEAKGLVTRDGHVITWDDPAVHHQDVAQHLPRGPKDLHSFLESIDPAGNATMIEYDPALEPTLQAHGLKGRPLMDMNWSF